MSCYAIDGLNNFNELVSQLHVSLISLDELGKIIKEKCNLELEYALKNEHISLKQLAQTYGPSNYIGKFQNVVGTTSDLTLDFQRTITEDVLEVIWRTHTSVKKRFIRIQYEHSEMNENFKYFQNAYINSSRSYRLCLKAQSADNRPLHSLLPETSDASSSKILPKEATNFWKLANNFLVPSVSPLAPNTDADDTLLKPTQDLQESAIDTWNQVF